MPTATTAAPMTAARSLADRQWAQARAEHPAIPESLKMQALRAEAEQRRAARRFTIKVWPASAAAFSSPAIEQAGETVATVAGAVMRLGLEKCLRTEATHQIEVGEDEMPGVRAGHKQWWWVRSQAPLTDWKKVMGKTFGI